MVSALASAKLLPWVKYYEKFTRIFCCKCEQGHLTHFCVSGVVRCAIKKKKKAAAALASHQDNSLSVKAAPTQTLTRKNRFAWVSDFPPAHCSGSKTPFPFTRAVTRGEAAHQDTQACGAQRCRMLHRWTSASPNRIFAQSTGNTERLIHRPHSPERK